MHARAHYSLHRCCFSSKLFIMFFSLFKIESVVRGAPSSRYIFLVGSALKGGNRYRGRKVPTYLLGMVGNGVMRGSWNERTVTLMGGFVLFLLSFLGFLPVLFDSLRWRWIPGEGVAMVRLFLVFLFLFFVHACNHRWHTEDV